MSNAKRFPLLTLLVSCALATAAHAQDRTAGQTIDDAAITTKVKAELIGNPDTKAHEINVTTNNGVVELSGFVDSAVQKQAAEREAKSVSGVKNVQNRLMVKTSSSNDSALGSGARSSTGAAASSEGSRSSSSSAGRALEDSAVTAKVKSKLIADSMTKSRDIKVETNNGVVQLNGFVSSMAEKQQAAELASSVDGVVNVRNDLQIKSSSSSDAE